MQPIAPSQALLADHARRASAARAIAGVFLVLTVFAFVTLLKVAPAAAVFQLISGTAYLAAWWLARKDERASHAGATIVAGLAVQHVFTSSALNTPLEALNVAYFATLGPLVAAATLPPSGVIAGGAAGALSLMAQIAVHRNWGSELKEFVSPALYFVSTWVVATFASLASNRKLHLHAAQEQRAYDAQAAARVAEARYGLVADHVSDLVSLFDANGGYVYASPSYARVLGVAPEQLVGRQSPELVHPDDLPSLEALFARALAGEAVTTVARLRAAGGDYRWFHVRLSGVSHRTGANADAERGVAVSARDVTELRELSEALEKTRRMEALGKLAGGIAHDFNNLLTVIQSCTELVARDLPRDYARRVDLDDIDKAVQRAAALTRQLLTFARRQVLPAERCDASVVTRELAPILVRLCGKSVTLSLETRDSNMAVDASPVQLEQLLMNLAANARDAMPDGGTLTIELHDCTLGDEQAMGLEPGRYVELTVTDTGTGMSAEVQQRIFEPFFTTKPAGRGTGLGLSTVFGLATQLAGRITVRSAPGAGSTFTVLLPESRREQPARPAALSAPAQSLDILLVDDEAQVRSTVGRMLRNAGHRVVEAEGVDSALAAVNSPGAHFDAVVTDVVIGSGDGISMLERLRALLPEAAVVVMSGFAPSPERVAAATLHGAEFLPKPFSAAALLAALARAQASRSGA